MTTFQMYWFLKADTFCNLLLGLGIGVLIIGVFSIGIKYALHIDDVVLIGKEQRVNKRKFLYSYFSIGIGVFLIICSSLIPTTKQLAILYVVPKIVNNEQVQKIPEKMLLLTADWLTELSPENMKKNIKALIQPVNDSISNQ